MPYFDVRLNDKPIITVGDDDVDILTVGVIKGPASPNSILQVTSMKKALDEHEIWINRPLSILDELTLVLHQGGVSTSPIEDVDIDVNEAEIDRSRAAYFLISSSQQKNNFFAHVDEESTLHVAATWIKSKGICNVEIACTRMTDNVQNEMWLEFELGYGEHLKIILK